MTNHPDGERNGDLRAGEQRDGDLRHAALARLTGLYGEPAVISSEGWHWLILRDGAGSDGAENGHSSHVRLSRASEGDGVQLWVFNGGPRVHRVEVPHSGELPVAIDRITTLLRGHSDGPAD